MKNVVFPLAFIGATSLVACSFQMRAGGGSNQPNQARPNGSGATAPAATPVNAPAGPVRKIGRAGPTPQPTSSSTTPPAPTPTTPPPGGHTLTGAIAFGSGTPDPAGFKGNVYWVDPATNKIPSLASQTPAGVLFASTINVAPQAFTAGFPGIDAARSTNFAIRYEAPLVVTAEADFTFRLVAEDGANLLIDNTPIIDNDGVKTAPAEKSGPVHLVTGTHLITVDYLQTTGNVALQLYCKKGTDAEVVCPTRL